jgi:hypothetical protein
MRLPSVRCLNIIGAWRRRFFSAWADPPMVLCNSSARSLLSTNPASASFCRKSIACAAPACWRSIVTTRTMRSALSRPRGISPNVKARSSSSAAPDDHLANSAAEGNERPLPGSEVLVSSAFSNFRFLRAGKPETHLLSTETGSIVAKPIPVPAKSELHGRYHFRFRSKSGHGFKQHKMSAIDPKRTSSADTGPPIHDRPRRNRGCCRRRFTWYGTGHIAARAFRVGLPATVHAV